jgi:kynurenine formamidase
LAPVAAYLRPDVALVLHTGWSAYRGTDVYFDHPFLSVQAAQEVLSTGVRTLGLDAPSIDETLLDGRRPALPVHHLIAAVDGVIVENLTGLESIDLVDPWLSVLPLLLRGGDGAPCRAVAVELRP